MRTVRRLAVVLLAAGTGIATVPASTGLRVAVLRESPEARLAYLPGQVIVQFKSGTEGGLVERAIREGGGARARKSAFGPRYLVSLDAGFSVEEAVDRFRAMPEVAFAEPNGVMRAFLSPNDQFFRYQWHLQTLNAERTWDIQEGDPQVVVAVVDTGIAYEDFGPFRRAPDWGSTQFVEGYNVFTGDSHANDDNFHGTHVASVIAEATDNGVGAAGFAFRCALMPIKVLDSDGVGSFFGVAEGMDFATNSGVVKVINLSLGGDQESTAVQQAADRANQAGIVVVAAAGNDGVGTVSFPARLDNVIAVGAVDYRKELAPYSNYGTALDVVAPGGDLARDDNNDGEPDGILQQTFDPYTAQTEGRYDDFGFFFVVGTSQAAPQVSALAALLVQQGITDPAAVKADIESTADDLGSPGRDDTFGHGLIDPVQALRGLGLNR